MIYNRFVRLVLSSLVVVLVPAIGSSAPPPQPTTKDDSKPVASKRASLGLVVRMPNAKEIESFKLKGSRMHPEGQVVKKVTKGSAADKAGVSVGDMLIALNKNRICSTDDVEDFLKVTKPNTKIGVLVKLAKTHKEKTFSVTLDTSDKDAQTTGLRWEFAGMGQLDEALAAASKSGKFVLVGLSGADT